MATITLNHHMDMDLPQLPTNLTTGLQNLHIIIMIPMEYRLLDR